VKLIADNVSRIQRWVRAPRRLRRTRLYGVGIAKSGTKSIASMFPPQVSAAHEADATSLIETFFRWHEGRIGDTELTEWIHTRDRKLALEVDSSWFNVLIVPFLAREFPDARFVLTVRDCYSWLNSEFKRVLNVPINEPQRIKLRKFLYDPNDKVHAPEERILKDAGLFALDSYLGRWAAHNEQVLTSVPQERLLVVRTDQIAPRANEIADFAGLPRHAVRAERTHENRSPLKRAFIRELDPDFLEKKVAEHCGSWMRQYYPEIKSLDDVKL
jgi:Sulfotransferase domain